MKLNAVIALSLAGVAMSQLEDTLTARGMGDASLSGYSDLQARADDVDMVMDAESDAKKEKQALARQCRQISGLKEFVRFANNATLVDILISNSTKAASILEKGSMADAKLKELETNKTLVDECTSTGLFAKEEQKASCVEMVSLQKLNKVIANETQLAAFTQKNETRANALKGLAAEKAEGLTKLETNETLNQFCSVQTSRRNCRVEARLEKMEELAKNETALNATFHGDTGMMEAFKAKTEKNAPVLKTLKDNSTLQEICSQMKMPKSGSGEQNAGGKQPAESGITSNANGGAMISLFAVIVAAVVLL